MPDTVLGTKDTALGRCLPGAHSLVWRQTNICINKDKNCDKCYDGKVQNTVKEFLYLRKLVSGT